MVVRKRRNFSGPAPTGAREKGARRDEAASPLANAREVASLNQAPDGRTRDAKGTPCFLNGDHCPCHASIVSRSSHRLNRLVRPGARPGESQPPEQSRSADPVLPPASRLEASNRLNHSRPVRAVSVPAAGV